MSNSHDMVSWTKHHHHETVEDLIGDVREALQAISDLFHRNYPSLAPDNLMAGAIAGYVTVYSTQVTDSRTWRR